MVFLSYVTNSSILFPIKDSLQNVTQFLKESKIWYQSVSDMLHTFSEYRVQQNVENYREDLSNLLEHISIQEFETRNINETNLKAFMTKIGKDIKPDIENMTASYYKLIPLKNLVTQSMAVRYDTSCESGKLVVKGFNVKISDVTKLECYNGAKYIEIFTLNKLFFDDNIEKIDDSVHLSIISPIWEISGNREIIMKGADGKNPDKESATDGTAAIPNGEDGIPGNPGMTSGPVLIIGNTFISGKNLKISASGGSGGSGQQGGKGSYMLSFATFSLHPLSDFFSQTFLVYFLNSMKFARFLL